jgi:cell division septation protein DedD
MTLNEAFIHTADDNAPTDLLEEAISEKLDDRITSNLQGDGESAEYNPNIVNNPTGVAPSGSSSRTDDEVTVVKTLPSGATESRTTTKSELQSQGFTDAQIAGTVASGIEGVTFQVNGA